MPKSCPTCRGTGGLTTPCGACDGKGVVAGEETVRAPRVVTRRQKTTWIIFGLLAGIVGGAFSAVIMLIPSGTYYNPMDDIAEEPSDFNRLSFRGLLFLCGGLGMVCGFVTAVIVWVNGSEVNPIICGFGVSAAIGALMGSWLGVVWGLGCWRKGIE